MTTLSRQRHLPLAATRPTAARPGETFVGATRCFFAAALLVLAPAAAATDCLRPASTACYFAFTPEHASGRLNYYASMAPGTTAPASPPTAALIAVHGHSRDADKTFDAALLALQRAGRAATTLLVAPLFQVPLSAAGTCRAPGVPVAQGGDLLWTCASWIDGGLADNGSHPGAFAVLDALVGELVQRWPSLRVVTIAGFSAGAQLVQHAIGFAGAAPAGVHLRYVVADPGSWLYFDPVTPRPTGPADADCPGANRWKYGTEALPAHLVASAGQARDRYAAADISYLEGEFDTGSGRGTAYKVLDKSCAAEAQGPYRLQRGLAYGVYDRTLLAPDLQRQVVIVPGCAHDVACVFPSAAARAALLGEPPVTRP